MLILVSDKFDEHLPGQLQKYAEVTDDKERLCDTEIVLVRSKTQVTRDYIDSAPNLKMVIRGGVGLDNIDLEYAQQKGIEVHNTAEASTVAVAELAFALMIALPNQITTGDRSMKDRKWLKKELTRTELMGKTLTILGLGRIGTALAIRARAFRMKIIGWHPDVFFSDFAQIEHDLAKAVSQADFVSMHMPFIPATKGLINKESLDKFKDGAYLINTGRGKCIVEEDVASALESGKLSGYGTDVWYSDPPDWNTPILKAPNVIALPHLGASSEENMHRIGSITEQIVKEYTEAKKKNNHSNTTN